MFEDRPKRRETEKRKVMNKKQKNTEQNKIHDQTEIINT